MEFSMNWEIMGALGEIVGGLGVILSLLYLARQISDNTSSNQSAAITSLTDQIMRVTLVDKESGAIFLIWFNANLQYQRKLIPTEFWITFAGDIASYFQHSGIVDTWQMIKPGFPPDFVLYVEQSSRLEADVDYLTGALSPQQL